MEYSSGNNTNYNFRSPNLAKAHNLFKAKFSEFANAYLSAFTSEACDGAEILYLYQDNYGCEQFKDFYFLGLKMIELGYPRICDDNNHHLGNAYLSSDFNIYENVWYPNGITEDDMENFRQLMNECVQLWMQWCAVTQSMLLYDEMIQRKSDGMSISVSEQYQYNGACQALENMCIN